MSPTLPILIGGGGPAGLCAALALAQEGFDIRLFEAAPAFAEIGAGLQLSPNATHILRRLGVLERLMAQASRPDAVVLKDATSLRRLAEVPLGARGEARWGAPYLVAHRAALQNGLLEAVQAHPRIEVMTGAVLSDVLPGMGNLAVSVTSNATVQRAEGSLLVGADGVWSSLRHHAAGASSESRFVGLTAWRATAEPDLVADLALARTLEAGCVTAFLDPAAHLVSYPLSQQGAVNLVAITRGGSGERGWAHHGERQLLDRFLRRLPDPLQKLASLPTWTRWPLYAAPEDLRWTGPRLALIGDAAHAMLPFAAQGAAMGIEDGAVLAARLREGRADLAGALRRYEEERRPRLAQVLRRGRLNRLAWHAAGPVALARDVVFRLKGPASLAADLDWLYGWREPRSA